MHIVVLLVLSEYFTGCPGLVVGASYCCLRKTKIHCFVVVVVVVNNYFVVGSN